MKTIAKHPLVFILFITLLSLFISRAKAMGGMTSMAAAGAMSGGMPGAGGEGEKEEEKEDEYPVHLSVLQTDLDTRKMMKQVDNLLSDIKDKMGSIKVQIDGRLKEIENTGKQPRAFTGPLTPS